MSPELFPPIPADTVKAARSIFGRSNFYLAVGDQANRLFSGLCLVDPAGNVRADERKLAILHLITLFQFIETLPDLLTQDALRERVDWKYALHLPLRYPFREASSLCAFRRRLLQDRERLDVFQSLLTRISEISERNGVKRLGLDAGHVVASVCRNSRLEKIWDTMSQCLEAVAIYRHEWLRANSLPHWYDRYSHFSRELNLRSEYLEQKDFAGWVGADGFYLLEKISSSGEPELSDLHEVQTLKQIWSEQFEFDGLIVRWKEEACSGCTLLSNQ